MKNLIIFLTILLGLNLNAMEKQECFLDTDEDDGSVIIHSYDEFSGSDEYSEDDEDIESLYTLFDNALDSGDSQKACLVLKYALERYPHLLNNSQIIYINFVITFIEAINLDKDIRNAAAYNKSEEVYSVLCYKFNTLIKKLKHSLEMNEIELDNVSMSTCYGFNTCLLTLAIRLSGSSRIIEFLVAHGITIDRADDKGNTPLHILGTLPQGKVNTEMIKCFIANNTDIDSVNHQGKTPLFCTITENGINLKALTCLIKNGANINAKDNKGNTFLHLLCELPENRLNMYIVNYLLVNYADISIVNHTDFDAYRIAVFNNNLKIAKILNVETKRDLKVKFSSRTSTRKTDSPDALRRYVFAMNQENYAV